MTAPAHPALRYHGEMSDADHEALIDALRALEGMVVVTGYDCGIYASGLRGWDSFSRPALACGQKGSVMRTETVWLNPACSAALAGRGQQSLIFGGHRDHRHA